MSNNSDIRRFRSHLRLLERCIEKGLQGATVCCGVTVTQCHTILEIDVLQSTTVKELAERLDLDKSTLSRVIEGLVNIGLVCREISKDDRRFMSITLTENGQRTVDEIHSYNDNYFQRVFEKIPQDKHDNIIESVHLLGKSLTAVEKMN